MIISSFRPLTRFLIINLTVLGLCEGRHELFPSPYEVPNYKWNKPFTIQLAANGFRPLTRFLIINGDLSKYVIKRVNCFRPLTRFLIINYRI